MRHVNTLPVRLLTSAIRLDSVIKELRPKEKNPLRMIFFVRMLSKDYLNWKASLSPSSPHSVTSHPAVNTAQYHTQQSTLYKITPGSPLSTISHSAVHIAQYHNRESRQHNITPGSPHRATSHPAVHTGQHHTRQSTQHNITFRTLHRDTKLVAPEDALSPPSEYTLTTSSQKVYFH
ncbi:hypothetical protein PoB_003796500 [Plakobranchus ocellatus]|uniref:Uncharacterized protein n=1 Tax=Plakobranchus ocellatus TaxID=259542 RepID=A0AAV4AXB7_9GAST|nr:hypothetical protein PoB_003796500 [Plakobranchus ocellatus]